MRLALLIVFCAMPAMAQDLTLGLPLDCTLGDTCYIQNYVDHDPSEGMSDFQCGSLSYDGHKGSDFGLPSLAAMEQGVAVFASASGTVRGVRNDMRDVLYTSDLEGEIDGRDCGNGVVIAHDNGWETQYCHMKEGSVIVRTGDVVAQGDILGDVGLSGRTQFPHVHISVRQNGSVIDPFAPTGQLECGTPPPNTLWDATIDTPAGGLLNIGFSNQIPDYATVKAGTATPMSLEAKSPVVLWAFGFGSRVNDVISITINGPDGPLFQTDDVLDRQQALFMRAGGLNAPDAGWPSGTYFGVATHKRDGIVLDRQVTQIDLP